MILTYKIYSILHRSYCCYMIRENKKCKLLLEKAIFRGIISSCLPPVEGKTSLKLSYIRIFFIDNCHIPIGWVMKAFTVSVSCMQLASALIFLNLGHSL